MIDGAGLAHVVARSIGSSSDANALRVGDRSATGTWSWATLASDLGDSNLGGSVAFARDGTLYVSYASSAASAATSLWLQARPTTGAWNGAVANIVAVPTVHTVLGLDPSQGVHIGYGAGWVGLSELSFAADGTSTSAPITTTGYVTSESTRWMFIDSKGAGHAVFFDFGDRTTGNFTVYYAHRAAGEAWTTELVEDKLSGLPDVAITADGMGGVHLVYSPKLIADSDPALRYAYRCP